MAAADCGLAGGGDVEAASAVTSTTARDESIEGLLWLAASTSQCERLLERDSRPNPCSDRQRQIKDEVDGDAIAALPTVH